MGSQGNCDNYRGLGYLYLELTLRKQIMFNSYRSNMIQKQNKKIKKNYRNLLDSANLVLIIIEITPSLGQELVSIIKEWV